MLDRRTIWCWLKGGILLCIILLIAAAGFCIFFLEDVIESALQDKLAERDGVLELSSVSVGWGGLVVDVDQYSQPGLSVEDLQFESTWDQLIGITGGLSGRVLIAKMEVDIPRAGREDSGLQFSGIMENLAGQLSSLRLSAVRVELAELILRGEDVEYRMGVEAEWLSGLSGEKHLSLELLAGTFGMDARMRLSPNGESFAVDFVASLYDWERFKERYLAEYLQPLAEQQGELYLEPISDGAGFVELSGYLRWDPEALEKSGATLLADVGPTEIYLPQGESFLERTSIGLTMDAENDFRAFAKGAIESVRWDTWSASGGEWEFKLNDEKLEGELRIDDAIELSLRHDHWRGLFTGQSGGRLYLGLNDFAADLIHSLELPRIPLELSALFDATIDAHYMLDELRLSSADLEMDLQFSEVAVPSSQIVMRDGRVQAEAELTDGSWQLGRLLSQVSIVDVLGVLLGDLSIDLSQTSEGVIVLKPMNLSVLGGQLAVERVAYDRSSEEPLPIRVELNGIDMKDLSERVPQFEGEVEGRLSGFLLCEWSNDSFRVQDGRLELDDGTGARLSYNVDGLLTGGMDPESSAYRHYRMAEIAFQDLALRRFTLDVFPEGEATRPLRIQIYGESDQDGTLVPVDYTLNVNADDAETLIQLLQMIRSGQLDLN